MTNTTSSLTRASIIDAARAWIGTPYMHQASAKGAGCDCLGLIRGVWRALYGTEPEVPPAYTADWPERRIGAGEETLLDAARRNLIEHKDGRFEPGDVLIFRVAPNGPAKHCGIVSAPDKFIHAYAGRAVVESWMNRWWRARIAGVFSFPSE